MNTLHFMSFLTDMIPLAELPDLAIAEFTSVDEGSKLSMADYIKPGWSDNLSADLTCILSHMFGGIDVVVC